MDSSQALKTRDLCTELRRRFSFTRSTHVKAIHQKARVKSNGRLLALIRRMEDD